MKTMAKRMRAAQKQEKELREEKMALEEQVKVLIKMIQERDRKRKEDQIVIQEEQAYIYSLAELMDAEEIKVPLKLIEKNRAEQPFMLKRDMEGGEIIFRKKEIETKKNEAISVDRTVKT